MANFIQRHHSVIDGSGLSKAERDAATRLPPAPPASGYAIYGESYCGFTAAARNMLAPYGPMFYEFHSDRAARNEFARQYAAGHGTIPMVFHNGRFVGGYAQLQEYMKKK